jgi:hypothetical protein
VRLGRLPVDVSPCEGERETGKRGSSVRRAARGRRRKPRRARCHAPWATTSKHSQHNPEQQQDTMYPLIAGERRHTGASLQPPTHQQRQILQTESEQRTEAPSNRLARRTAAPDASEPDPTTLSSETLLILYLSLSVCVGVYRAAGAAGAAVAAAPCRCPNPNGAGPSAARLATARAPAGAA